MTKDDTGTAEVRKRVKHSITPETNGGSIPQVGGLLDVGNEEENNV